MVALIEVTDVASQPEGSKPEQFADGRKVWWRYSAPTKSVNSAGFISRKRLTAILNYAPNYVFHGFGEEHSGLKEISRAVFDRLLSEFNAFTVRDEKKHVERGGSHRFGGAGEGTEHKALKRRIAADPAGLLGEPGLTLWEIEWPLATGDKIDLVSKDALGRFVAVEIEVQCGQSEMAGPLQCMKYRALLSYYFDRPLIQVRCILVAHSIHSHVCARCSAHLIETRTVSAG